MDKLRLFHVSEEAHIEVFEPRIPVRKELDQTKGLVWAITEACLPNFLTPRNCPRVAFHTTSNDQRQAYDHLFSTSKVNHVVAIENKWFETMKNTTLYVYEFDTSHFVLQDQSAGYYVSTRTETPIAKYTYDNLFSALFERQVEVRLLPHLWDLADTVKETDMSWSLCRMGLAIPRPEVV